MSTPSSRSSATAPWRADPALAAALDLRSRPRRTTCRGSRCRATRRRRLAVVAASERALAPLVATASRSGWRTVGGSAESIDPAGDDHAAARRRRERDPGRCGRPAGGRRAAGARGAGRPGRGGRRPPARADRRARRAGWPSTSPRSATWRDACRRGPARPGRATRAPGGPLADLLSSSPLPPDDSRRALGAGALALAEVLDRRVDVVEIGFDGGTRAAAAPGVGGGAPSLDLAVVADARRWRPPIPTTRSIDRVGQWSTWGADRHRLRDRMRELRIAPWADATGDGVTLRMAAARAALGRLARVDPGMGRPASRRTSSSRPAAPGRSRRHRPSPSPWSTSCAGRAPASSPWTTPGSSRRSGSIPDAGRAAGDGRRPGRRPPRAARDRGDAGRPAIRAECRLDCVVHGPTARRPGST